MEWLDLTPRILADDEAGLVVEERHFGRSSLWLCALFLAATFVVPAVQASSVPGAILALGLGVVVVGLPFLIVLALNKYRRLEVRRGAELVSVAVYRLRRPRSVRVGWDEVARVVCTRRRAPSSRPGRMVVTLHTADGTDRRLLAGWYSADVEAALQRHLASKFATVETFAPF